MAPPNTPIIRMPEALEVYCCNPLIAKVNMQPHITEWHSPTDTNIHQLLVRIATNISIVAIMVVTVSNMRGETLLKKLNISLPTIKPPQ